MRDELSTNFSVLRGVAVSAEGVGWVCAEVSRGSRTPRTSAIKLTALLFALDADRHDAGSASRFSGSDASGIIVAGLCYPVADVSDSAGEVSLRHTMPSGREQAVTGSREELCRGASAEDTRRRGGARSVSGRGAARTAASLAAAREERAVRDGRRRAGAHTGACETALKPRPPPSSSFLGFPVWSVVRGSRVHSLLDSWPPYDMQALGPVGAGPAEAARSGGRVGGSSFSSARSSAGYANHLAQHPTVTTWAHLV